LGSYATGILGLRPSPINVSDEITSMLTNWVELPTALVRRLAQGG
jgi:hypothetical protein